MVLERLHDIERLSRTWKKGARPVINAIRKEERDKHYLLSIDYSSHLWLEKEIRSVANVARRDIGEFLELAAVLGLKPQVRQYALEDANRALPELKEGKIRWAKVLLNGALIIAAATFEHGRQYRLFGGRCPPYENLKSSGAPRMHPQPCAT